MDPRPPAAEAARSAEGGRPEESWADRAVAGAGFRLQQWFRRSLPDPGALAAEAGRHAARLAGAAPAAVLPDLRYRLRKQGLRPALLAECFGWIAGAARESLAPPVLGAAAGLAAGRLVELPDDRARQLALGAAAGVLAVRGDPVHVICHGESRAGRVAGLIRGLLEPAGIEVGLVHGGLDDRGRRECYPGPVVCGAYREFATDYLRDRLRFGWSPGRALDRLAGDAPAGARLLPAGLGCALVDQADAVMIDDARVPIAVFAAFGQSPQRLQYEQALELARVLVAERDYEPAAGGVRLTEPGAERVERLTLPLGGAWSLRWQREELVCEALGALHLMERDVDYRVERGRVVFAGEESPGAEPTAADEVLRKLIEIKEGCRLSERREVLARISLPRFLGRYPRLAGICEDARGLERDLWRMYRLHTVAARPHRPLPALRPRVFACAADKLRALASEAAALGASGSAPLLIARSPGELRAAAAALEGAGIPLARLQGQQAEEDRAALEALARGEAVLALYPALREAGELPGLQRPVSLLCPEFPDAARHLHWACRAFAAGGCGIFSSLEDEAVAQQLGRAGVELLRRAAGEGGELPPPLARLAAAWVQRGIEGSGALLRQELMALEQYLGDILAFSGRRD
jgi:preprotein translocase subunit SecA